MPSILNEFDFASAPSSENRFRDLWALVGNTPMLEIVYSYKKQVRRVYAKCEHYNLTGSIKDRMALYILQKAYKSGRLQHGDTILEATGINSAVAFSDIGKALGHNVRIIMPSWVSNERIEVIKSLGAEVIVVSEQTDDVLGSIQLSEKIAHNDPTIFLPRQFQNRYNSEVHEKTTAKEIWLQLFSVGKSPDAFVAGVGTGGTVMGVAAYLKKQKASVKIHPLQAAELPMLSKGVRVGSHRIEGISNGCMPTLAQLGRLNHVLKAVDGDSIIMAQKLARQLGLGVGISSGANMIGAIQLQNEPGLNSTVVTVFSDSSKKYLSTDLMKEELVNEGYYSGDVEFLDYTALSRAVF